MSKKSQVWRARWAAVGAAVAVTLGAGGMLVVNAEPVDQQTGELEFVAITPTRFFDSRIDAREGGIRPFNDGETQQLDFSEFLYEAGTLPTPSANIVGAVVLNVTAANQQMRGFLSVNPSLCLIDGDDDCPGPGFPETSNINWNEDGANIANHVTVILGEWDTDVSGVIDITMEGNPLPSSTSDEVADVIVDVVGYYVSGDSVD